MMSSRKIIRTDEIDKILDKKIVGGKVRYLVKWRRFSDINTWEPAENFISTEILNKFDVEVQGSRKNVNHRSMFSRTNVTSDRFPQACEKLSRESNRVQKSVKSRDDNENSKLVKQHVINLMESELQCSICQELFREPTMTFCGHTFCHKCIDQWKKHNNSCPMCRSALIWERKVTEMNNFISKATSYLKISEN